MVTSIYESMGRGAAMDLTCSQESAVIGAIGGAIVAGVFSLWVLYQQIREGRKLILLDKIEKINLIIDRLLHSLEIVLKSKRDFFLDPEKYYHRDHPEGEYFI